MTTKKSHSVGGTGLLVLAVLFLALTVLSNTVLRGQRLDLTENQLYTISQGTRDVLASLEEPVRLYFFFSNQATESIPQLRDYARRVRELLQEFVITADGKLQLTEVDPLPFSEEEDQASQFGLQAVSLGGAGDPIYMGVAGTNAVDDLEIIEFFQPDREAFLEYDLAKLVYNLSTVQRPVVGLISTLPLSQGFDPRSGQALPPWAVTTQMEQLFEVRNLDPGADAIDEDIALLVLVHPKNLGDATLYAIDQFVMGGGKLLAFVDPISDAEIPLDPASASGALFADRSSNLEPLFNAWGFSVEPTEVVLDAGQALSVNSGTGQVIRHLAMIGARGDALSRDDVITANLDSLNFGSSGHITRVDDSGTEITPLVQSTDQAALTNAEKLRFLPDPLALLDDFAPTGERYVLAARVSGALQTAFPEGPPAGLSESPDRPEHRAAAEATPQLIVVADTDMLSDRMWVQVQNFFGQRILQAFADNGSFAVNGVDNLTGSSDLIAVRSRGTFSRPFERVEDLRREADANFRAQEQALQQELDETESRLQALQSAKDEDNMLIITPEQQAELLRFQDEKLRIRKALRDVRRNLDRSIERLGTTLKVINIGLVPLLLSVVAIAVAMVRVRRRDQS
ncbi:MAG: Gldg family protein [Gammaproteobacteria bacterium]